MQITASYLNQLTDSLNRISATQQQLSSEISSGARVSALSQDPSAVGENVGLDASIQQADSYHQAAQTTTGLLQVTDATLASVVSQLTQAVSTATAGANGTNSAANLGSIATQLAGIRDEVLSLANTSYTGGYLFAGSQTGTAPYSLDSTVDPAVAVYHGDTTQSYLTSPLGSSVALNIPGSQIFSSSAGDVFGTLNRLVSDFSSGNLTAAQTDTGSLTAALTLVTQQRVGIDNSITRIASQDTSLEQQSTQLQVRQTNLMQADTASVATSLSSSETQMAALQDVIAGLEKQGNLFDLLH